MELQASRQAARIRADGSLVPLQEQDRARWDRLLVRRGLAGLARAEALGGGDGAYALQAALAACHARAGDWAATDWPRIAELYDRLLVAMPSPVVALNRAIAHGMAFGPEAALALLDGLEAALAGYAPLPAARGDALLRAGRPDEARAQFEAAAALTRNARERDFLLARAAACGPNGPAP
jgi:predicted RNA polymerase sigma factor